MILLQPAALLPLLPPEARLLGVDAGEKTIGLALSDVLRSVATPLETIGRSKFSRDMERLKAIVLEYQVGGIVLGYPLNMDGSLGPRAQSIRAFAANVEKELPLPILLWDERMSTMAVERAMREAELSRKRRDTLVDKLAAAYILQGALDAMKVKA